MRLARLSKITFLVLSFPVAAVAAPPCDLQSITSRHPQSGPLPLQGQTLSYSATPSWSFADNGAFVRITEKIEIRLPGIQAAIVNTAASQLPNSDCNVTSSLRGSSVASENPDVVAHIDFSGTKWACPGLTVPCPTWRSPGRTCYKRLAKTIVADGTGSFQATLHPSLSNDGSIQISPSSTQDFHLSRGTGLALGLVINPVVGLAVTRINLIGSLKLPYSPISIPMDQPNGAPIQLEWTNSNVYFDTSNGTITLTRQRYIDEPPNTACYLKGVFSKM